jgi:hypothetical protein
MVTSANVQMMGIVFMVVGNWVRWEFDRVGLLDWRSKARPCRLGVWRDLAIVLPLVEWYGQQVRSFGAGV